MKNYKYIFAILAVVAVFCSTSKTDPDTSAYSITNETRMAKPMMKGVELYSWKNEKGEWNYALLIGTNTDKPDETIRLPSNTITSLEELKKKLSVLAEREQVSWGRKYLLPSDDVQRKIRDFCKELKIKLN